MKAIGYLYIYLLEAYFLWNFAVCLFPKRYSARRTLSVLSVLYLILWGVSFFQNMFLSLASFAIAAFLFLYLCFSLHWTSAVFHATSLTLTMSLSEFFCLYLYDRFLPNYWGCWYLAPNLLFYGTLRTLPYFLATLLLIGLHQPSGPQGSGSKRTSVFLFLIILGALCISIPPLFVIGLDPWQIEGFAETLLMLTLLFMLLILFLLYALQTYDQQKNALTLENKELTALVLNLREELAACMTNDTKIVIETADGTSTVPTTDIVCVEVRSRKVFVHTTEKDYVSVRPMKYWQETLTQPCFFQTHRSFIVNLSHIVEFDHDAIRLAHTEQPAYLTRRRYHEFKERYLLYLASSR